MQDYWRSKVAPADSLHLSSVTQILSVVYMIGKINTCKSVKNAYPTARELIPSYPWRTMLSQEYYNISRYTPV